MRQLNPKEKRFCKQDMIRWARYVLEGKLTDTEIENWFEHWFLGPERYAKRYETLKKK